MHFWSVVKVVLYIGYPTWNPNFELTLTVVQFITYYTLPYFSSLYSFSLLPKNYAILGWAGVAKLKNEQNAPCLFSQNSISQICTLFRFSVILYQLWLISLANKTNFLNLIPTYAAYSCIHYLVKVNREKKRLITESNQNEN